MEASVNNGLEHHHIHPLMRTNMDASATCSDQGVLDLELSILSRLNAPQTFEHLIQFFVKKRVYYCRYLLIFA